MGKPKTITVYNSERVPVDKTAAIVTSEYKEDVYLRNRNVQIQWDAPPPTIEPTYKSAKNLMNTRRGSIVIVGFLTGYGNNGDGSRMLARCDCGKYEVRRTKSWRKGLKAKTKDFCQGCKRVRHLREKDEYRRLGFNFSRR